MPKKLMLDRGRVVADLLIQIFRNSTPEILGSNWYASSADTLLVLCGIWIGQAEGKPMTVAKLAEYIGMPRATAIRKTNELIKQGCLQHVGRGKLVMIIDRPEIDRVVKTNVAAIHSAARMLSKLDG